MHGCPFEVATEIRRKCEVVMRQAPIYPMMEDANCQQPEMLIWNMIRRGVLGELD